LRGPIRPAARKQGLSSQRRRDIQDGGAD